MADITQKEAAKRFSEFWKDKGYEKGQSQPFWLSLLREVFGIAEPEKFITFEDQVHLDNTSFIDGYIESTHVMIEQKSLGKDLQKKIKQSNGALLTPYEQAKRYSMELPYSKRPRWIVTSNFESFLIYDMERPGVDPQLIYLKDLSEEYWRLEFLVDDEKRRIQKEQDVSEDAGIIIKLLYDALAMCYGDMTDPVNQKSLNKLIVRLVFCLYAEDSEMFSHGQFQDYISHFDADDLSDALYNLFKVLDTREEDRRRGLKTILSAFPYTNGGLFHDKPDADDIDIPPLTDEVKRILSEEAAPFNWSAISPTIFGGIFESTLNPLTRRKGGMHYTSIENIHKVIDPLFLDDLRRELDNALDIKVNGKRKEALLAFQRKIANLKFLDPACGSGNFLTETYLSLRRLENKVIRALYGEGMLGFGSDLIKVSIQQFYGIEINDFAVSVATTALWISEAQMLRETESIISQSLQALPLKTYTNIHEGNALRMDWNEVVPATELDFIMGNPPFVGYKEKTPSQKAELEIVCKNINGTTIKNTGSLDYVCGWYYKAALIMYSFQRIRAAFVSTNSITQGEQVAIMWKPLFETYGLTIDYAYRSFVWNSEAKEKAKVHCVIIGFSISKGKNLCIYKSDGFVERPSHINAYLYDAPDIWIYSQRKPISAPKEITLGVHLFDNHFFIFTDAEKKEFVNKEPSSEKFFKKWVSASDFLYGQYRWFLDLQNCSPDRLRQMPYAYECVKKVLEYRRTNPSAKGTSLEIDPFKPKQGWKADSSYIIIPNTSGKDRNYLPIAFVTSDIVVSMPDLALPNGDLYDFGVLSSSVHMVWIKVVCGRLKSDLRYANGLVYNNFPWPVPTDAQKEKIEQTAQSILDARVLYPDSSLADLYDDVAMPPELRKAHRANDAAVMEAYGFRKDMTESEIVAELFKMYQKLVGDK